MDGVGDARDVIRTRGRAVLLAAVAANVVAVLGVEVLSLAHAVHRLPVCLLVALTLATAVVVARREGPAGPRAGFQPSPSDLVVAVIALVTLAVALVAAPNTWDSMTYHLPRVVQWAGHGSVEHYPTSIDRQLWQPPFAEYLVLLLWVALGGDRLANLPAWLAAGGAVLAVVETTRLLGRPTRERRLAALAAATLPGLVLEATSTQTDVVAALWIAVMAYLALVEWVAPTWSYAWLGAAFGLALGTKGMGLPFGLPWIVIALVPAVRARRYDVALRGLGVVVGAVLVLNAGLWFRNVLVFNGPLGPTNVQTMLRPASLDPRFVATNLLTNLGIHLGTPWPAVNDALTHAAVAIHTTLGLDVAELYPFFGGYRIDIWNTHENVAGDPVQLILAAIGAALAFATWRRRSSPARAYVLALAGSVLLLAASVRWQPYNARLHLPLFVVLAPGIAATIVAFGAIGARLATTALVVAALPSLLVNATRPVIVTPWAPFAMTDVQSVFTVPRLEQYFAARRDVMPSYVHLMTRLDALGCHDVRLKAGYDGWEYPLWILRGLPSLDHAFVLNASTEIGEVPLAPEVCVVVIDARPGWTPPDDSGLTLQWSDGPLAIWRAGSMRRDP